MEDSGLELTLANFLEYYHLDPRAIYRFSSFSRICARADVMEDFSEPMEETLTKAFAGWPLWTPDGGYAFCWTCCPIWTMWTSRR